MCFRPARCRGACLRSRRPIAALEREWSHELDTEDWGGAPGRVDYGVEPLWVRVPPRRTRMPAIDAVLACVVIEARLHALLKLLVTSTAPPPVLQVALVTGTSLSFPQHVVVVDLHHALGYGSGIVPDTLESMALRQKAGALLERKWVRYLVAHDAMEPAASRPSRTRVLVRVPAHVRAEGWAPRRSWAPPSPAVSRAPGDASTHDAAAHDVAAHDDTGVPPPPRPARASRMSSAAQHWVHAHAPTASRRLQPRQRRGPTMAHWTCTAGLDVPAVAPPRDIWLECDTSVQGYSEDAC